MITWIIFGFIVGLLGVLFAPRSSSILGTLLLGMLGAVIGGFLATTIFAGEENTSFLLVIAAVAFGSILLVTLQRSLLKK